MENAVNSTRGDAHFSMTYLGSKLNHTLFAFGHLNIIYYSKCPNIHELKCLPLEIIQTVAIRSILIFENALTFLIKSKQTDGK